MPPWPRIWALMMVAWSPVARLGWLTLVTRGWSARNAETAVGVAFWARTRTTRVRMLRASSEAISGAMTWLRFLRQPAIGARSSAGPATAPAVKSLCPPRYLVAVGAVVQRVLVDRGGEGVVDGDQSADRMRLRGDRSDVEDVEGGVGRGLEEHDPGAVGQHVGQPLDFARSDERGVDAQAGQVLAEQFEGAAVDVAQADDVITGAAVGQERRGFGCHAGAEGHGGFGVFKVGQFCVPGSGWWG